MKYLLLPALLFSFSVVIAQTNQPANTSKFVRASGTTLLDSTGNKFIIKGIAFGNWVNTNTPIPETHHGEVDFKRIKMIGFNAIRFYIDYHTLEDDSQPYQYKQAGWDWLDKNIAWAKQHHIYLLLNMHVPQGGYQSQGTGIGLWNEIENQNRLSALWKAIADRYKNENIIAGYGLVNEPVPVNNINQWQQLAQKLRDNIREADKNHLLFMESILYVKNGEQPPFPHFTKIKEDNICYEFHFYEPLNYTHQLFDWYNNAADGGNYPDEDDVTIKDDQWNTGTFGNPALAAGNSDWKYYEGEKFKVEDTKIKIAKIALVSMGIKEGTVLYDDLIVKEYDAANMATGKEWKINTSDMNEWYYWSKASTGVGSAEKKGRSEKPCLKITGSTEDASFIGTKKLIAVRQGYSYQVNGYMKGTNVPADAACRIRLDFFSSDNNPIQRDKEMLQNKIENFIDWGIKNKVPVFLGEFGAGFHCFESSKGGLNWVSDMMDICKEKELSFNYHAYHEDAFGLYLGWVTPLDVNDANNELINLLNLKLRQ